LPQAIARPILGEMEIRDDDLASTVLELEQRMPRGDIAAALGVDEDDVAEIASGYLPDADVAARLRRLASSPEAPTAPATRTAMRLSGTAIAIVILADLVFFALVAAFVFLR
jgi:hypothetical protein